MIPKWNVNLLNFYRRNRKILFISQSNQLSLFRWKYSDLTLILHRLDDKEGGLIERERPNEGPFKRVSLEFDEQRWEFPAFLCQTVKFCLLQMWYLFRKDCSAKCILAYISKNQQRVPDDSAYSIVIRCNQFEGILMNVEKAVTGDLIYLIYFCRILGSLRLAWLHRLGYLGDLTGGKF